MDLSIYLSQLTKTPGDDVDVPQLIRHRLDTLGLDQKDLAAFAQVTESYISQLLTRKKAPPAPARTDIYEKFGRFLGLPAGELARVAELQRQEQWKKRTEAPPPPLFRECRELILRKCKPDRRSEVRRIFGKETFGELERLVTQRILDVAQGVARDELRSEAWLRPLAEATGRTYEQMRVAILEFLDSEVLPISLENWVAFLDPMIVSWDIDLKTFAIEIVLNRRLAPATVKRFEYVEQPTAPAPEPGLEQFLSDKTLSATATEEEIAFLKSLRFPNRHPTALYYYRELQSLRDPLHFPPA
jgi:transcriptional regulator with XRE-family HTH domain